MLVEVSLTPQSLAHIDDLVSAGAFASRADAVAEAVARMADDDQPDDLSHLKAAVEAGRACVERGETVDGPEAMATLRARLVSRTGGSRHHAA